MVLQRCLRDKAVLDVECGGGKALHALSECYSRWADEKQKSLIRFLLNQGMYLKAIRS